MAALDNVLILVSLKTRSASIAIWVLEKCLVHENEA